MSAVQDQPLYAIWKERLDLAMCDVPELFEDPQAVGPIDDRSLGAMERFSSGHCRDSSGANIKMRHALLPFSVSRRAGRTANTGRNGD